MAVFTVFSAWPADVGLPRDVRKLLFKDFFTRNLCRALTEKLSILSKNQLDIQIQQGRNRLYCDFSEIWCYIVADVVRVSAATGAMSASCCLKTFLPELEGTST